MRWLHLSLEFTRYAGPIRDVLFSPSRGKSKDQWTGYVGFSGDPDINNGGWNVSGTLSEVMKAVERK